MRHVILLCQTLSARKRPVESLLIPQGPQVDFSIMKVLKLNLQSSDQTLLTLSHIICGRRSAIKGFIG